MSNEQERIKHSKRRHANQVAIARQMAIIKAYNHSDPRSSEPHRYVKRHAMGCANPRCIMCSNPRKVWGEATMQEKRFDQQRLHDESIVPNPWEQNFQVNN